jgi:hypothetical protein
VVRCALMNWTRCFCGSVPNLNVLQQDS